ncbi:glycoside hydrolase family 1 [Opitutaceae bacterium EW11]|nr:glycoside hydrolase family 1 [Opitutaceae bacterium EW11]
MPPREKKIAMAWLETPTRGVVELSRDWRARQIPPVTLGPKAPAFTTFTKVPDYLFGAESGYFVNRKGEIFFFLALSRYPELEGEDVYLAGDFNGWQDAVGRTEWRLQPAHLAGSSVLLWSARRAERFYGSPNLRFKFVTGKHRWMEVPPHAPNAVRDEAGNINYLIDPERTGQHLFQFTLAAPLDLSERWTVSLFDGEPVPLRPGDFFFKLYSEARLGALARGTETVFRLFAPRAKQVTLAVCDNLERRDAAHTYLLRRREDHVWEITLAQNLHGWYYWYLVEGPNDAFGAFDAKQPILDPYAMAAVDREGPGIILDAEWISRPDDGFKTPSWHDLVIAEAHVRDLAEKAPTQLTPGERRGFAGLAKWVESPDFYLKHLGVNAVELQPVHEFDNRTPEEYHWGYMTNNYFAVESSYSLDPRSASGVKEFQALVQSFHRRGIAVLIDVVYNHVGEPAHLMGIDKLYYFEMDSAGRLSNWSGCGNDLRARSAMARRLIVDSLTHLIEVYGVDGFRFDLAELLGVDVLREIEAALKRVKPDVILIAEPWSFRGHIAGALRDTGWASWNDGYRNFLRDFVRGGGTREGYEYYLKGSPWYFAKWPSQTVNYTESHDDKTWIDIITENPDGNGFNPTANDRRRTHLMAAVLFASVGIPMIAAGQDFLRSKLGVNNTYLRGDLNALDYRRIFRFPATHAYFADWIDFRLSDAGQLLRHFSRPSEGYFKFFFAQDSTAAATVYNADHSRGGMRMLFAVNPTLNETVIGLDEATVQGVWRQVADHEHFFSARSAEIMQPVEQALYVPPLSCGVWLCLG